MFKNYFKIAWRNIVKNKFYSLVNIVGLASGIAFTILISAYIWGELQVNKHLKNASQQYIILSKWKDPTLGFELATLGPLAKALRENYPDLVANYYRFDGITSNVSKDGKIFREGLQLCDSTMLTMYGFSLLHGNPATAFSGRFTLLLTAEMAKKYFGRTDVTGQTITIENFSGSKHDFLITGVLEKPIKNSVTQLTDDNDNQFYISIAHLDFFGRNMDWNNPYIASFIELKKGITAKDIQGPVQSIIKQHGLPQISENMTPYLVSLDEYYLTSNNGLVKKMLYALSAISLFILLMAIINFINMSVSRSASRMREIGIRKVLGGLKTQLIAQFLLESVILVFFATVAGLLIFLVAKNLFSEILARPIPGINDFPFYFIGYPLLLILVIGSLAGIYPAFVLSSLKSVESLKGKLISVKENVLLRKSLVGFQFCTATIVFIGAIIISRQINLFFSKDLGFNKDYIVSAQLPRNWTPEGVRKMEGIRNQFARMPQVSSVTLSYEVPDGNSAGGITIYKEGDSASAIASQLMMTDELYASTYNIPMAAGLFYCRPGAFTDSSQLVINETQARVLGWKNVSDAIGKQLRLPGGGAAFTVAGVVKDFHFGSMQKAIQPITFLHVGITNQFRFLSFKLKPGSIGQSIAALQKEWSRLLPGTSFEYKFMDETLKKLYRSEIQLKQASYMATVLSLIIVLLGVLGLVSLSIQKRTKEIGIRKILGSTVSGIIALFMKEFLWVILLAGLVACPVAWFIMNKWLSDYVYRIDITAEPFILAIALLSFLSSILITAQTIRTAWANPAVSLRVE